MMGQYYLFPITILLTILYILSYFLYSDNKITDHSFKIIWNIVLIASSLIVVISGMVMVIFINFEILPLAGGLIFWHVEAGILTAVTGIFHLHIYWKPSRIFFK